MRNATACFHPLPAPTNDEVLAVLDELICRLRPTLVRLGLASAPESEHDASLDPLSQEAPLLAAVYAGSVQGRSGLGERRGRAPIALGKDPRAQWLDKPMHHHAQLEGFDLHAPSAS